MAAARCWWAGSDPLMISYHDGEWGVRVHDDRRLFEMLSLEGFQAGLSWQTILRKRDNFRHAFAGFEPRLVAAFGEAEEARLLGDAGIVRNRAKIAATVANARALLELQSAEGSFSAYLAARLPPAMPLPQGATPADLPARTPASDALSKDLRSRGFGFVGSTIVYAFMQATGLVDDHLPGCFRYRG